MSTPNWTSEQRQVIDLRDRNILVSAAAGSGKTAVLVERIIAEISEGDSPKDIDKLLVVTFTKAAAAEMRARIGNALEKKLLEQPENKHIQRQASLLHTAQITTIDSFCQSIIKNYFHIINLDPSFRVGDETDLELIKQEILKDVIEEKYQQARENGDGEFLQFTDMLSTGRTDHAIEEMVLSLYQAANSYPWPEEWLSGCSEMYQSTSVEEMEGSGWIRSLLDYLKVCAAEFLQMAQEAYRVCQESGGPEAYADAVRSDIAFLEMLQGAGSYQEYQQCFGQYNPARLKAVRSKEVDGGKKEYVKNLRENYQKNGLGKLKERFFFQGMDEMLSDIQAMAPAVKQLILLTMDFGRAFAERKREDGIVDFADMERFALEILLDRDESGVHPSETAKELQEYYEEILTDEYQDSNYIQELLLSSLCRAPENKPYLFMVGDVKQSIYKFRLARPEIFMEKYLEYEEADSKKQRIDLHQNFRSRKEIIDSVNFIFYQLMGSELGGISYDEKAALLFGADFLPCLPESREWDDDTEILLVEKPEKEEELSAKMSEAYAIAKRIKQLLKENQVTDKESGKLRTVSYKDIVVLLRTNSGWDEEFRKVFSEEGIPSYITSKTGYFKTTEIQTVLQFLRVLDNPLQDIPLFGVLHSVFGGFDEEETARIKVLTDGKVEKGALFFERLQYLAGGTQEGGTEAEAEESTAGADAAKVNTTQTALREKIRCFLDKLERYRDMVSYLPIHELLQTILGENNYFLYVTALSGGEQRRANVDMLLEKAVAFEQTSYHGLFHFIRYIEQMEKYDVDYGEAGTFEEEADVVRIMSIHKSKGLEFPICFVAGLSKRFNMQDTAQPLIADIDMGIGTDFIDPNARIRNKTLRKNVMAGKMKLDNIAEELRILYVALTRAREKLLLTGCVDKPLEKIGALSTLLTRKETLLPYSAIAVAGSYMDLLLAALVRHPAMQKIMQENGMEFEKKDFEEMGRAPVRIELIGTEELVRAEVEEQVLFTGRKEKVEKLRELWELQPLEGQRDALENWIDKELYVNLSEKFSFVYPYENLSGLYTKTTVSELKKAGQNEELDFSVHLIEEEEVVPYIPGFMKGTEKVSGTTRGSAMHKIMELLDFEAVTDREGILAQMEAERKEGRLSEEFYDAIRVEKIETFLKSDLCKRMKLADEKGMLYRESPFVYGISAEHLNKKFPKEETVLVQGIVDVYFEEEGELVVADYKTDVVKEERELSDRYRVQLDYYAEALEKLTGKPVKEKIIYSFYLGKEISI